MGGRAPGLPGSALGRPGALDGESTCFGGRETLEGPGLYVLELQPQTAVGTMALDATPKAVIRRALLADMLCRIVLGTARVQALPERVSTLEAVGAHAATRRLLAVFAGDCSTNASRPGGGGANGLLELRRVMRPALNSRIHF